MNIEYTTDEQMRDLVKECGLDWHRGYMPLFDKDPTNRYAVLIKAVIDFCNLEFHKARSEFCAGLGAVLTYTSNGRSGVHGMTIGADGSGDFAVLFMGTWADSESAAAEYLSRLQQAGYRISTAHIVPNERLFSGTSVRVVDAPLPRFGRRTEP